MAAPFRLPDPFVQSEVVNLDPDSSTTSPSSSPAGNMDQFLVRLLTFFNQGTEGFPSWPHATPAPEDMAGAGFTAAPTGTQADNVKCQECDLQCFRWEAKDDPYSDHLKNAPTCPFVQQEGFGKFHQAFLAKCADRSLGTPPTTPFDDASTPKTPKRRRGKSALSKIQTVVDLEPVAVQAAPTSPMRIQISGSGVSMDLTVHGSENVESPTKRRRFQ